jgi:hypothetical protein
MFVSTQVLFLQTIEIEKTLSSFILKNLFKTEKNRVAKWIHLIPYL